MGFSNSVSNFLLCTLQERILPTITRNFDFEGFSAYLQGIAGGSRSGDTANAIVADVKLFFSLTPARSSSYVDTLINKPNLERFIHYLVTQRGYKPTTIAEKIRRMKMAIKYVTHAEDSMITNRNLFMRGSLLLEVLSQWGHSLSKAIALQRQQHSLKTIQSLPLIVDPQEFLENEKVCILAY